MSKVEVNHSRCISCAGCVGVCPVDVITLKGLTLVIDQDPCISCSLCIQMCPVGALTTGPGFGEAPARKPSRVITLMA